MTSPEGNGHHGTRRDRTGISTIRLVEGGAPPLTPHSVADWRRVRKGLGLVFMSLAALALACVAAPIFDRLSAGRLFANPKVRDLFLLGGTCILAAMLAGHCLWCAAPSNSGDRRGRAFAIGAFGCLSLALLTLAISSLAPEIQKTIILLGLRLDWQDWAVWFFYLSAFLFWSWHVLSLLYLGSVAQNLGRRELHSRIAGFLVIFGLFSLAAVVIALTSTFALLCSLPVAILWYLPLLLRVRTAIGEST